MKYLYPVMFPDSKIAKRFKSNILNEAMIPSLKEALVKNMKEDRFGLVNNGSSDNGMKTLIDNCTYIFCIKRSN